MSCSNKSALATHRWRERAINLYTYCECTIALEIGEYMSPQGEGERKNNISANQYEMTPLLMYITTKDQFYTTPG